MNRLLSFCSSVLVLLLTGCAAHCDRSQPSGRCPPCYEEVTLPGRPDSRTPRPYEAAAFGNASAAPVLLLHDMNGASPNCLWLAKEISGWGFRVYVPNLFAGEGMRLGSKDLFAASRYIEKNPDWKVHHKTDAGRIVDDLACMTREISRRHGGHHVRVIGNCLTGIHPLALLDEPCVRRVVLCQPATPLKHACEVVLGRDQGRAKAEALGLSEAEVEASLATMSRDQRKKIAVLHFSHDPLAPMARVHVLYQRLKARGLASRLQTYVLKPVGEPKQPWWTDSQDTTASVTHTNPHSTIVNADCSKDLQWFRDYLKDFLLLP